MRTRGRRAGRAGAGALAVLLTLAGIAGPAAGGTDRRAGSAGATVDRAAPQQAEPAIRLVEQPDWVRPGEPFAAVVQVTSPPEQATVDLVVHQRVRSRAEFRETLDGELGSPVYTADPVPVSASGAAEVGFTPSTDAAGLGGRGVYPVELRVRSDEDDIVASTVTYLNQLTESPGAPLDVGVMIDIAAPPALQPDGSVSMAPEWVARARQRIEAVEAASATPVSLAPLPETVDGLAGSGDEGAALVDQLRELAMSQQVVARPYVDIDLAALQDAGLDSEAYAQSDAGANVSRSRLSVEPAPGVWLSGATWRPEGARRAVAIGFDRAVVPATAVGDGTGDDVPLLPVRLGDGGPLAMVGDPDLAAHLTSGDGVVAAHRFLAELAITWLEAPSERRGVAVEIPADADVDPEVVSTALTGLSDGHAVRAVPVTQLFTDLPAGEDGPTTVDLAPAEPGPDLVALAPRVNATRTRVGGATEVLDDPTLSTSLDHLLLMVTGVDTPSSARSAYLNSVDAALGGIAGAVTLPDEFRITLTTRSATIPVQLTNNTEEEVPVRVELESDQLEFPDGAVLTPTLAPGTTRLEVRVRTRTSGAFTLDVTVSSRDDSFVLDRSTFDIRSTAISGVGLLLSAGAVLFLALWWGRHYLRARRGRREGDHEPAAPPPAPGGAVGQPSAPEPVRAAPATRARSTGDLAPWASAPTRPRPPAAPHPPPSPLAPPPPPPPPGAAPSGDGPVAPTGPGGAVPERSRAAASEPYRPAHMARSRGRSTPRRS